MDPIEWLVACEEIRQLISRRTRLIDGKHWDELVRIYADDVPAHHLGTNSNTALVEEVARRLDGVRSIHHVHLPEIELLGPTEARAIVPMEDVLIWENDGEPQWAHGYGHYHQSFRKVDRGWVITDHKLTRQYLHQGSGHFELAGSRALADPRFNQALTPLPRDFP